MRFSFWLHLEACGILVPQPGIEPVFPAVEVWSPNHWTTREVPILPSLTGSQWQAQPLHGRQRAGTREVAAVRWERECHLQSVSSHPEDPSRSAWECD